MVRAMVLLVSLMVVVPVWPGMVKAVMALAGLAATGFVLVGLMFSLLLPRTKPQEAVAKDVAVGEEAVAG